MPVYLITGPDDERLLVNAKTKARAVAHVMNKKFTSHALTTSEMADLLKEGLQIEDAVEFNDEPVITDEAQNEEQGQ